MIVLIVLLRISFKKGRAGRKRKLFLFWGIYPCTIRFYAAGMDWDGLGGVVVELGG